jgi:tripartite-type tricarboxylate transporter receptor subunit TctC
MIGWRTTLRLALCLALPALSGSAVPSTSSGHVPAWPSKPIRLLVGFPPGSSPDFVARAIAEPLSRELGQPVVVENRPGASGNIATAAVVNAADAHTFGVVINGNMTVAKLLSPATPFDPLRDLLPVGLVCEAPLLLAAPANASGSSQEFLVAARSAGSKWSYGSPGVGTIGHLATEVFKSRAHIAPVHVPYPSYQKIAAAMVAGELQVAFVGLGAAMPLVEAGRLRAVGVTAAKRTPLAPNVPTLAEAGLPSMEFQLWTGVAAPKGTDRAIVQRLAAALSRIASTDAVRQQLRNHGYESVGLGPDAFAARIAKDYALLEQVIRTQGIRNE